MPWASVASTALSVGGSLLGGSKSKSAANKAVRAQQDAMAAVQRQQDEIKRVANTELATYQRTGSDANKLLAQYLGIGDPVGYDVARPDRQTFANQVELDHYNTYGKNYNRDSSMANENLKIDALYNKALADWEAGRDAYLQQNPNTQGDGRLLKEFTNEDFVKDPGYDFRLQEGEKGINRALSARGGYDSGSALKALARYNQDYGSNEFNNAFNRDASNKSRIYSFLSGTAGAGQQAVGTNLNALTGAANQISNAAQGTASNIGQIGINSGNTQANALQGAIGNLIYGINRPKDSGVTSVPTWSTPPINGYNNSAGNNNWWSNNIG